jgi:hypothetical protein
MKLKDFYPISEKEVKELIKDKSSEYTTESVNTLLLKLADKYPGHTFAYKKSFLNYMTKILSKSKIVAKEEVQQDSKQSIERKKEIYQKEKYLQEVEYSKETTNEARLRRKISACFDTDLAYDLLFNNKIEVESETHTMRIIGKIQLSSRQKTILLDQARTIYGDVGKLSIVPPKITPEVKESKACKENTKEFQTEKINQETIWGKVRLDLQNEVGLDVDKAWFSKLIAKENLELKVITLIAPSAFFRDWIQQRYGSLIDRVCKQYQFRVEEIDTEK